MKCEQCGGTGLPLTVARTEVNEMCGVCDGSGRVEPKKLEVRDETPKEEKVLIPNKQKGKR